MKSLLLLTTAIVLTGCVSTGLQLNGLNNLDESKSLRFSTNESKFINRLDSKSTKESRNQYIDEFILKSDVQCQQYLHNPKIDKKTDDAQSTLYMNIAHTVSSLMGLGYITQTAEAIFLNDDTSNKEAQEAYENALSPEIIRGVEIVRERYAFKIKKKKNYPISKYNSNQVTKDISLYDQQCDKEYGLIEINRALKEMQEQMRNPTYSAKTAPTKKINIESVKKKVKDVSKEVKEKKKREPKKEKKETKGTTSPLNTPITNKDVKK